MPLLEVRPMLDLERLAALCLDPYVSRVGHDDRPVAPIDHPSVKYYGAYVDGELAGAFMLIESGYIEVDVHALLLRSAVLYSRELGTLFLDIVFREPTLERVTAYIIDGLNAARNYCFKLGFKYEGTRRRACKQNGKILDVNILGMTRNDWKESQ